MQKLIAIVAIAFVSTFTVKVNAQEQLFQDVPPTSPYYEAVQVLADYGAISTTSGKYNPSNDLTRGQMAKMMAIVLDLPLDAPNPQFADVPTTHEFYPYIAALADEGIISGYPDGRYGIKDKVKRSHMAKFIARGFDFEERETLGFAFTDLTRGTEAHTYASTLQFYGITVVEAFQPSKNVTRGQVALFLQRAIYESFVLEQEGEVSFAELGVNRADAEYITAIDEYIAIVRVDGKNNEFVISPYAQGKTALYINKSEFLTNDDTKFKHILVDVGDRGVLTTTIANTIPSSYKQFVTSAFSLPMNTLRNAEVTYMGQDGSRVENIPVKAGDGILLDERDVGDIVRIVATNNTGAKTTHHYMVVEELYSLYYVEAFIGNEDSVYVPIDRIVDDVQLMAKTGSAAPNVEYAWTTDRDGMKTLDGVTFFNSTGHYYAQFDDEQMEFYVLEKDGVKYAGIEVVYSYAP